MQEGLKDRINSFIGDPNAISINGSRRMGRSGLMDQVQEVLSGLFPDSKIIRIDDGDTFDLSIISAHDILLIVDPQIMVCYADPLKRLVNGGILLFSTQELCHQVPVCIKGLHGLYRCKDGV